MINRLDKYYTQSTNTTNQVLIKYEVQKLIQLVSYKDLYRKGIYLYDVEKFRPQYNIAEFAWTFCEIPLIANQVVKLLDESLEDIIMSDDMSDDEILDWVNSKWDDFEHQICTKRGVKMCEFLYFICTPRVYTLFTDLNPLIELLELSKEKGWSPAHNFIQMLEQQK